ncbi:MarR family transcriptional regulator [Massilia sp. Dwa41.01b]|uniref:MarR family winged helix-turn-helix transcriptional regulator n=1 Tax=unclassified Massilia TaxID=2609279 RepID=UPI00160152FD|nr:MULTISPECIES: MarR family transcriptional regulator [unclassified Massilia]QNA87458.1 MarR family transcriptional regulator [Massilia sp. Dwa41.01b]QNA98364.1 MarR family transcriptional regulator [Massilia sp. Se16.2.3]
MDSLDHTLMQLTTALTQASRAYKSMADKVASEYSLSQATALPVLILGRLGAEGVRPGVLADALGLEASSLVRVVDLLIDNGLIERREDPQDRRAKILQLTDDGTTRAAQMEAALIPFRRSVFGECDPADIDACLRVLTCIQSRIGKPSEQNPDKA